MLPRPGEVVAGPHILAERAPEPAIGSGRRQVVADRGRWHRNPVRAGPAVTGAGVAEGTLPRGAGGRRPAGDGAQRQQGPHLGALNRKQPRFGAFRYARRRGEMLPRPGGTPVGGAVQDVGPVAVLRDDEPVGGGGDGDLSRRRGPA